MTLNFNKNAFKPFCTLLYSKNYSVVDLRREDGFIYFKTIPLFSTRPTTSRKEAHFKGFS